MKKLMYIFVVLLLAAPALAEQPHAVCALSGRDNDGVAVAFGDNHVWINGAAADIGHIAATIGAHVTGIPNFNIRIGDVAAACHNEKPQ